MIANTGKSCCTLSLHLCGTILRVGEHIEQGRRIQLTSPRLRQFTVKYPSVHRTDRRSWLQVPLDRSLCRSTMCHSAIISNLLPIQCIDQNDSSDTEIQIQRMGDVYAAAILMIVAAAGGDASYGLTGLPPMRRSPNRYEKIVSTYLCALPSFDGLCRISKSKWASRAWTQQEGFCLEDESSLLINTSPSFARKTYWIHQWFDPRFSILVHYQVFRWPL